MPAQVGHDRSGVFLGDGCIPDRHHSLNQRIPVIFISSCPLGQIPSDLCRTVATPAVHGKQNFSLIIGQKCAELLIGIGLQTSRTTLILRGVGRKAKVFAQVGHDRSDVFLGDGCIPDRYHLLDQAPPKVFISSRTPANGLPESDRAVAAPAILQDQRFSLVIRQKGGEILVGLSRLLSPNRDHQR